MSDGIEIRPVVGPVGAHVLSLLRRSNMFIAQRSLRSRAPLGARCDMSHRAPNGARDLKERWAINMLLLRSKDKTCAPTGPTTGRISIPSLIPQRVQRVDA